jgi:diadenosine tetraphosphate (Ap4A) HIT family hydrolase
MIDCKLCSELKAETGRAPWNEPLIETENFVVIPSLGALIEGWLLVVPKEHHISMGALPIALRSEADDLERRTRALLKKQYEKPIIAFEHGPSAAKHSTGCGVDHAHLHLLPLDCDLLKYVRPFVPIFLEWRTCDWERLAETYRSGLDYLYLRSEGKTGLMAVSKDFGSQIFRRAVSLYLGVEGEFSWRDYPRISTVSRTVETLASALATQVRRGTEHAA